MVELSSFVLLLVVMPVSLPLSYKFAVYFIIKNVHFILGSVKVAEWGGWGVGGGALCNYTKLLPRLITMIYYVLFVKDLCCFVCFFQFVISASKFSRSPYLDNHLSESTHTLTIGSL